MAEKIYSTTGWKGAVCSGPGEELLGEKLIELAEIPLVNFAGKISLMELIGFVKKAKFLISNDTGNVHIAARVNTPSICILGGWHFGRFLPYPEEGSDNLSNIVFAPMKCFNCNGNCIYNTTPNEPFPCIKEVKVKQVIEALEKISTLKIIG